jgi:general secretion pathway protein L
MSIATSDLRLFGLQLPALWQDVQQAWGKLLRLPAFAWLAPRPAVIVHEDGGARGLWQGAGGGWFRRQRDAMARDATPFIAVELPEALVLRRELTLPHLASQQRRAALELQARALSPFAADDLAWSFAGLEDTPAASRAELVLASRRAIAAHVAGVLPDAPQMPEVWVRAGGNAARAIVLHGFGEARRQQAQRHGIWQCALLAAVACVLALALALTPTLQLRQRALGAVAAWTQLAEKTRPAVAEREALLVTEEQIQSLRQIIGERADPLHTLQMLTQLLPDDTMLQRLQIEGSRVVLTGQTPDTAALLQKLSSQPGFKDVRAPTAATRTGTGKEVFQIELTLQQAAPPAAPSATPGGAQ